MSFKWNLLMVLIMLATLAKRSIGDGSRARIFGRFGRDINNCLKLPSDTTYPCLGNSTLNLIDDILRSDVIRICKGVKLIRLQSERYSLSRTSSDDVTWLGHIRSAIAASLSSHILQINVTELFSKFAYKNHTETTPPGVARLRRHRNSMMMAMMFAVTGLGAVLVPMGFQLLSVISGKALLLAKLALLLASMNGLKKIASSGVHYGLYQVPEHSNYGYYERGDVTHPRDG